MNPAFRDANVDFASRKRDIVKMENNTLKAYREHGLPPPPARLPTADIPPRVYAQATMASDIGKRKLNEDAHFFYVDSRFCMAGIFDGHLEKGKIAAHCKEYFVPLFMEHHLATQNVKAAFEHTCQDLNKKVYHAGQIGGSTLLVVVIDLLFLKAYTATLGDSEAKLYRRKDGTVHPIPLSCIRNFGDENDKQRVLLYLNSYPEETKTFLDQFDKLKPGEKPRFMGLNVSRSVGNYDVDHSKHPPRLAKPVGIHPKIGVTDIEDGDKILLACDGLWDVVPEDEPTFANTVMKSHWNHPDLAKRLVQEALARNSQDNVSCVVIEIRSQKRAPVTRTHSSPAFIERTDPPVKKHKPMTEDPAMPSCTQ